MRHLSAFHLTALLFVGLFATPAAAQDGGGEDGATTPEPDRSVTVEATEFQFSPNEIEAKPGTTIEIKLVNKGNVAHSYDVPKLDIQSEKILPDESTTVTFEVPAEKGDIQFVCDVPGHKRVGMKGTLHVKSSE